MKGNSWRFLVHQFDEEVPGQEIQNTSILIFQWFFSTEVHVNKKLKSFDFPPMTVHNFPVLLKAKNSFEYFSG